MVPSDQKRTLALTVSCILLADVSILLNIPVLRQVLGFALLTIIPGFLLVQMLKVRGGAVEKALFTVGLSISVMLFLPLCANFVFPAIGTLRPISTVPLTIAFSALSIVLSLVAYKRNALDVTVIPDDVSRLAGKVFTPPVLGAAVILTLGVLGGVSMQFHFNTLFSLFFLLSVTLAVVLIVSGRIPERLYPLYILVIAVALQYSHSLSSPYLQGADVQYELYLADVVKLAGVWDPSYTLLDAAHSNYAAMLSILFLPNVYSFVLNLDTTLVHEVITPLIFAFVPLGIYQICKTQLHFTNRSAFLSAFFFMSFYAFYYMLPRQEVAELFLILIVLLIMHKQLPDVKKSALLVVFLGSMVVSHYAITYLFLLFFAVLLAGSAFIAVKNRGQKTRSLKSPAVIIALCILALSVCAAWYASASAGAPLSRLLNQMDFVMSSIANESFSASRDPMVRVGMGEGLASVSFMHALARYWGIMTEILVVLGVAVALFYRRSAKIGTTFLVFSGGSLVILLATLVIPRLGVILTGSRLYGITLLFLAPLCIFGIERVTDRASRRLTLNAQKTATLKSITVLAILVPYFLFNAGFVFEVAERPVNYAFNPLQTQTTHPITYNDVASWSYLTSTRYSPEGIRASVWLSQFKDGSRVYTDSSNKELISYGHVSPDSIVTLKYSMFKDQPDANAYFYLGAANVQQGTLAVPISGGSEQVPASWFGALKAADRVYSNGLTDVCRFT